MKDKPLFTPGPLTTSRTVKEAMLRDLGSRDKVFIDTVRRIRARLLALAGLSEGYEAILMQGSGTFAVESVISSAIPPDGKLLVAVNGAYGRRMTAIAERHGIPVAVVVSGEAEPVSPEAVDRALAADAAVTHVAIVHCETTSGVINPIADVGAVVKRHGRVYFVDSMSAFGAVPFDFEACHIDFLVTSANKNIEGVPGFGVILCRRAALEACEGRARTVSLDLFDQWEELQTNGQFRTTPPTHAILAFDQALDELEQEGVEGRAARYRANHRRLLEGMEALGFREYVPREHQGYIITSFLYPDPLAFTFEEFYNRLNDKGFVIYPGKVTDADCFRIGTVGRLFTEDIESLLEAVGVVLTEMRVDPSQVPSLKSQVGSPPSPPGGGVHESP